MNKCIALAMILLGVGAQSTVAQTVGNVITNGLWEPDGVAVGWNGNVFVSDMQNGIVKYSQDTDVLTNFYDQVYAPAGMVYVPSRSGLFVGDMWARQVYQVAEDGTLTMTWGAYGEPGTTDSTQPAAARFSSPGALAADAAGNVYVADVDNGSVRKISTANAVTTIGTGFNKPSGLAVDDAGRIYVADTLRHTIKMIDTDGSVKIVAGTGQSQDAGYKNGAATTSARFNKPRGLLWVGGKVGLLICDTDNHAVRQLYNGIVSTYASFSASSSPYNIAKDTYNNYLVTDLTGDALRSILVTAVQPAVSEPKVGQVVYTTNIFGTVVTTIAAVTNGTFYNDIVVAIASESGTETFYVKGSNADEMADPSPSNGYNPTAYAEGQVNMPKSIVIPAEDGPDVVIKAIGTATARKSSAVVTSVYHFQVSTPTINGTNPGAFSIDTGATEEAQFWYTVDGTDPVPYAANAYQYTPEAVLNIVNGTNNIDFRIQGFKTGYKSSRIVQQTFLFTDLQTASIGVLKDFEAGIGSTIVVPVKVKMPTGIDLRSLQFRVEITPDGANDAILNQFRPLAITPSNDFIVVQTPVADQKDVATFSYTFYSNNVAGRPVRGLAVSFIGTNSNFKVTDFATVAMLAVPIPATANEGDSYTIGVKYPSGTSDGLQNEVPMVSLEDRHITIKNIAYLVGDSAVAEGYNAGEFGSLKNNGSSIANLANNDVNNAFYASLGIRTPFSFTDAFDAMDAFPVDSSVAAGGDGQIRYLDWQIIMDRALRLDTNNWMRAWSVGGRRSVVLTNLASALSAPAERQSITATKAWVRQALVSATPVENAQPGSVIKVPVTITGEAKPYVAGLQFRAIVEPLGSAPDITTSVEFVKDSSLPEPARLKGGQETLGLNEAAAAWSLVQSPLPQAKMGKSPLGYVTVTIPSNAQPGQQYRVRFESADGAPDLATQYDFETLSSIIWVGTPAQASQGTITDEWKKKFFGNIDNTWAAADADPDGDGVINAQEYQNGNSPVKLRLQNAQANGQKLPIRWFGLQGSTYVVETSSDLENWTTAQTKTAASTDVQECEASLGGEQNLYYRVRVK